MGEFQGRIKLFVWIPGANTIIWVDVRDQFNYLVDVSGQLLDLNVLP